MKTRHWVLYSFILAFSCITILTACSSAKEQSAYKKAQLVGTETWQSTCGPHDIPAFLDESTDYTRALYADVRDHSHIMREMNCYCGCIHGTKYDEPHDSLLRCYWAVPPEGSDESAEIVWTDHSTTCGICKIELETIVKLQAEGKSLEEIKQTIDREYGGI